MIIVLGHFSSSIPVMTRVQVERDVLEEACETDTQRRRKRQTDEQTDMVDMPAEVIYKALDGSVTSFTEVEYFKDDPIFSRPFRIWL